MLSSLSKWNPTVAPEIPLIRKAMAAKGRFIWTDAMEQEYKTVRKKEDYAYINKANTF